MEVQQERAIEVRQVKQVLFSIILIRRWFVWDRCLVCDRSFPRYLWRPNQKVCAEAFCTERLEVEIGRDPKFVNKRIAEKKNSG